MGTENMENSYQIPFISDDERNAIKNMSVYALPDSPAAYGMKAGAVKPNFWKPLVCGDGSLVGLINTMISILNGILADVKNKQADTVSDVAFDETKRDLTVSFLGKESTSFHLGDGIKSIALQSRNGLEDTYEITFLSGEKSTFTVRNGADAFAPQFRIDEQSGEWEVSTDGGDTWEGMGVVAPIPPISDVQIDGSTIVDENGVADIPVVADTKGGVGLVRLGNLSNGQMGVRSINGKMCLAYPDVEKAGLSARKTQGSYQSGVVSSANFDLAVKIAMTDGIGTAWTETEQAAARVRMGAVSIAQVRAAIQQTLSGGDLSGAYVADGTFSIRKYTWDELVERAADYQEPCYYNTEDDRGLYAMGYDVIVPDTMPDVGYFYATNIILPETTTHVEGSDHLYFEKIYIKATDPPELESDAFDEMLNYATPEQLEKFKIVVHEGCGTAYENATNWSEYKEKIEEGEMPI